MNSLTRSGKGCNLPAKFVIEGACRPGDAPKKTPAEARNSPDPSPKKIKRRCNASEWPEDTSNYEQGGTEGAVQTQSCITRLPQGTC